MMTIIVEQSMDGEGRRPKTSHALSKRFIDLVSSSLVATAFAVCQRSTVPFSFSVVKAVVVVSVFSVLLSLEDV